MQIQRYRDGLARVAVPSPTLPPATCTNAWLLGETEIVVVDPAGKNKEVQDKFLEHLKGFRIKAILLTHHHNDHICGALQLSQDTGSPIWASQWTADKTGLPIDRLISEEDTIQLKDETWKAMITPGHANGHICLYSLEHGDLVAGDMIAGIGTILLAKPEGCLGSYFSSLKRLIELNPKRLLPAHGPAIESPIPYLKSYISHREMRNDQIMETIGSINRTSQEIAEIIYSELPKHFLPLAVQQVECHLAWLLENSLISSPQKDLYSKHI